jgi:hypothetical protein
MLNEVKSRFFLSGKKKILLLILFLLIGVYSYSQIPNPPTLISPPDSSIVSPNNVLLDWSDVPTATSYRVQVSLSSTFSSMIVNIAGLPNSTYMIPLGTLSSNTLYYWRANATNQNGTSQWSGVWRFITASAPPMPPNVYPVNGGNPVYPDSATVFKWSHVLTATSYRIQISTFSPFTNPLIDVVVFDTLYIAPPGTFNYNTMYYFRVASINNGGQGPWSPIWTFTSFVQTPSAPVLICDTANVPLTPTLNWNDVPTATSYRIQVSTSENFTSTIIDAIVTISQYTVPSGILNYSSHYYWRVAARNNGGQSGYSAICSFYTIGSSSIRIISSEVPTEYKLYNNYPNPFNPTTKIKFDIPASSLSFPNTSPLERGFRGVFLGNPVKLVVYDVMGREVQTLVNEKLNPGTYEVTFDGSNLSSGIYFYQLRIGDFIQTKKLILLK